LLVQRLRQRAQGCLRSLGQSAALKYGTQAINKVERFGWTFAPGDKVMQIENDYDKEVYNGDIGYIDDGPQCKRDRYQL
jgi:ATP-dependent exoDNAse (exonuclease V) alpha subunit